VRVKEPEVRNVYFFLVKPGIYRKEEERNYKEAVERFILEAGRKFLNTDIEVDSEVLESAGRRETVEFCGAEKSFSDGSYGEIYCRTLYDSAYVELIYGKEEGEYEPQEIIELLELPFLEPKDKSFLEKIIFLSLWTEDKPSDVLKVLNADLVLEISGAAMGRLNHNTFLMVIGIEDGEAKLVRARDLSAFYYRYFLPSILSYLKIKLMAYFYEEILSPEIEEIESHLEKLTSFKVEELKKMSLDQLEKRNLVLAEELSQYVSSLSQLKEIQHTVEVNLNILKNTLKDAKKLAEEGELFYRQLSSDLIYFEKTQEKAEFLLQNFSSISSLKGSQWDRRIALLLGLFTAFEIVQAFPELNWEFRIALILSVAFLIYIFFKIIK